MGLTRPQFYQIDTEITKIHDPVIGLNLGETTLNQNDIGFVFNRVGQDNLAFIWDKSSAAFTLVTTGDSSQEVGGDVFVGTRVDFRCANVRCSKIKTDWYEFPIAVGNPGDVLTSDGAGNVTWEPLYPLGDINGGTY